MLLDALGQLGVRLEQLVDEEHELTVCVPQHRLPRETLLHAAPGRGGEQAAGLLVSLARRYSVSLEGLLYSSPVSRAVRVSRTTLAAHAHSGDL